MVVRPLSFSASMTRWKPSVCSGVSSLVVACSLSVVACVIRVFSRGLFSVVRRSNEETAMRLHMRGEIERVLPGQSFRELGVPPLQRLDDLHMINDGTGRAVVLADGDLANGADMDEQVLGHVDDELAAAHADDRLVKPDIGLRVLVELALGRLILEVVEEVAQRRDLLVRGVERDEPRRQALERRPD